MKKIDLSKPTPSELVSFFKENYRKDNFAEILPASIRFGAKGYKSKLKSDIHPRQHPDELLRFMKFMEGKNIDKYVEIGIEFGGTLMVIDSFLRSVNPNFKKSIGIDKRLDLNNSDEDIVINTPRRGERYLNLDLKSTKAFQEYKSTYPTCKFVHCHSDDYEIKEQFDMVFIDSNGKYNALEKTFNQFKDHSRYIAFHDICDTRYGTGDLFKNLSAKYNTIDISLECISPGIGIVVTKEG